MQGRYDEVCSPASPDVEEYGFLYHHSLQHPLRLRISQPPKAAAESQQEAASTSMVELGHRLMDYKAVCMAAEASLVGVSCQSDELHAVSLPNHLALWEVTTGDDKCCLIAVKQG